MAPIIKNGFTYNCTRGMTPIEKNIIVVDQNGNEYEATYPKRAKGLVKNGRARFIADNKIALAAPPNIETEDSKMSENKELNVNVENGEVIENTAEQNKDIGEFKELLDRIEAICDTESLFKELRAVKSECPDDIAAEKKVQCISDLIREKEETKRRLIEAYENRNKPSGAKNLTVDYILEQIEKIQEQLTELQNTIRHIACVEDRDVVNEEEGAMTVSEEVAGKKVSAIAEVFNRREESLIKFLDFYKALYDDLRTSQSDKSHL